VFNNDFEYNHRPDDHKACCEAMRKSIEVDGSVKVLTNYRHVMRWERACGCTVLNYCPWCLTALPH